MKNIVFIKYSPMTKKVYEDYCFNTLLELGYVVEYWDISNLFDFPNMCIEEYKPENNLILRSITSYKELNDLVEEKSKAVFITMMTCVYNQKKLLKIFTKYNVTTAFWGPDPVYSQKSSFNRRIKRVTAKKLFRVLSDYYLHLLLRLNLLHYYKYYFSVGEFGYRQIGIYDDKLLSRAIALPINSFDYNKYHYKSDEQGVNVNNYIVFIDQYLPLHPDNIIIGKSNIPADAYYKELNNCFSFIEKQLNMKIVIAAHPKALKYKEKDYFDGRKVVFNQTSQLIKNASLVLAHYSTAIDYAVMSYKPVLLLNAYLFEPSAPQYVDYIMSISSRLGFNVITIEDCARKLQSVNLLKLTCNQKERYESFINEYCTAKNKEMSNEFLLPQYINKMESTIYG